MLRDWTVSPTVLWSRVLFGVYKELVSQGNRNRVSDVPSTNLFQGVQDGTGSMGRRCVAHKMF